MDNRWIRKTLQKAEPYVVPAISESIVINANESPYTIFDFPEVRRDYEKRFARFRSCCYPDPYAEELRLALSGYMECEPGEILVGNGGDEIIGLTVNTFINPGDTVLTHWPTFDMYGIDAVMIGGREVRVPDEDGFVRNAAAYRRKVEEVQPKLTVICNPNNPTGHVWSLAEVESIAAAAKNPLLVDEAYMEFAAADSAVSLIHKYDNLIVLRTLSKSFGLAGYRIGYAVANKEMIKALSLMKPAYNVNAMSQLVGLVAMDNRDKILAYTIPRITATRRYLAEKLRTLPDVAVYDSAANFILIRVPDGAAAVNALSAADIAVRSYKTEALKNCLRLTVTTNETADRIITALRKEYSHA